MAKFKEGDTIKRVHDYRTWAPQEYTTTVVGSHQYMDAEGDLQDICPSQWELVESPKQLPIFN